MTEEHALDHYKHDLFERIAGPTLAWTMYIVGLDVWAVPMLGLAAPCLITMYMWQREDER